MPILNVNELLNEVDELIKQLFLIRDETDPKSMENLVALYERLFNLLFIDAEHPENILRELKTLDNPNNVLRYAQNLKLINTQINELNNNHPLKGVLQERALDNIKLASIEKFENSFNSNSKVATETFITENIPVNIINTVEVRTWGTEREYSNGLRNVVAQKLRNDDSGHAAVVMRVSADEHGIRLIQQYCMDEKGSTIIPFELKKIENQVVYEIYWSYWPGRLQTIEQDYEFERRGLEYREIKELDDKVPKELSDRYIIHKFRKGKIISLAAPCERATVPTYQKISNGRSYFLDMQERQIKLEEEIQTLTTLLDNYLGKGKAYYPSKSFTEEKVKRNSNFFEILRRFKSEIKPRSLVAKILYNQSISSSDIKKLTTNLKKLIKSKQSEIVEVSLQLKKIKQELQPPFERSNFNIEDKYFLNELLERKKRTNALIKLLDIYKEKAHYPLVLPEDAKFLVENTADSELPQFYDEMDQVEPSALEDSQIKNEEDLLKLINKQKNIEEHLDRQIEEKLNNLLKIMKKEILFFKNDRENGQINLKEQFEKINQSIDELHEEIEEILSVKEKKLTELREQDIKEAIVLKFSKDKKGNPLVLHNLKQAEFVKEAATIALNNLLNEKQSLHQKMQIAKLKSNTHVSEISQKQIRRGYPYKSNTLRGFNIEEMLKVANNLSNKVKNFNLKEENCATTSMKLLKAGSPEFKKGIFSSTKPPIVPDIYKFVIKSDVTEQIVKINTIYVDVKDGKMVYSLIDSNGNVQRDVILDVDNVPNPLDLKNLAGLKNQILKDMGDKGFIKDFEFDNETFLTNPQAVYSAARVYERLDVGDKQAIAIAAKMLDPKSRKSTYNQLINKISAQNSEDLAQLQNNKLSIMLLIWEFIKHPTAIVKLYKDYAGPEKEQNSELFAVESQLKDIELAIRNLNNNRYIYIGSGTAAVAIIQMLEALRSSPYSIPFFTNEKLEEVDKYIFNLAQKNDLSIQDKNTLLAYDKIIAERDSRIVAVEKSLANGIDIKTQLEHHFSRSKITHLKFTMSDKDMAAHQMDSFIKNYVLKRDSQFLSIFRTNFVKKLNRLSTNEDKLASIKKHINKKPNSRTARVWIEHIETDPIVINYQNTQLTKVRANDVPLKEQSFSDTNFQLSTKQSLHKLKVDKKTKHSENLSEPMKFMKNKREKFFMPPKEAKEVFTQEHDLKSEQGIVKK